MSSYFKMTFLHKNNNRNFEKTKTSLLVKLPKKKTDYDDETMKTK